MTLIELILVMVLLLIVMASTWPRLGAYSRGRVLSAQADALLAMVRTAGDVAAARSEVCRLEIDRRRRLCRLLLRRGGTYAPLTRPSTMRFDLPAGLEITVDFLAEDDQGFGDGGGDAVTVVDFQPDGSHRPVRLTLANPAGDRLYLYALTALEGFRISDDYEATVP